MKKTMWVFLFQKYAKFWSVSLVQFIKHKPLFSEEWLRFFFKKTKSLFKLLYFVILWLDTMLIKIGSRVHTLIVRPDILPRLICLFADMSANGKFIGKSLKTIGGLGLCVSVGKLLRLVVLHSCLLYKLFTMKSRIGHQGRNQVSL